MAKTIDEQLETLAQHMNRIGKEMMQHENETYKLRGTELRVAGAMIKDWAAEIKQENDSELDKSSPAATEELPTEAEDSVEESE